ncbi:hypothetical protein [Sporichthya polymorpha]|uniref:hypothetical protein n=1 Tax=Sporichthya polymorpha TaxID=35751 RepID=UPI00035D26A1|nr:hypothetical protein [Sporichthya polymorpha]
MFAENPNWAPEIPDELDHQLMCPHCGGGAAYVGTLRASHCPFCAAPVALADVHESGGRFPIDGVIPFRIDSAAAHRAVRHWIARAWFAPRGMRLHTKATHYARVYVPVLSVDARLDVDYTAIRTTFLVAEAGRVGGFVRDVVIPAGSLVDQKWLDRSRPWPLDLVVPYRPEYLAGAFCESYDLDLPTIRNLIHAALRKRGEEMAKAAIESEYRYEKHTPYLDSPVCRSSGETYRHLLIPIYLVTTRHGDSVRQLLVSGIDGSIAEQTPVSAWKIGVPLAALGILGLAWPWLKDVVGF